MQTCHYQQSSLPQPLLYLPPLDLQLLCSQGHWEMPILPTLFTSQMLYGLLNLCLGVEMCQGRGWEWQRRGKRGPNNHVLIAPGGSTRTEEATWPTSSLIFTHHLLPVSRHLWPFSMTSCFHGKSSAMRWRLSGLFLNPQLSVLELLPVLQIFRHPQWTIQCSS